MSSSDEKEHENISCCTPNTLRKRTVTVDRNSDSVGQIGEGICYSEAESIDSIHPQDEHSPIDDDDDDNDNNDDNDNDEAIPESEDELLEKPEKAGRLKFIKRLLIALVAASFILLLPWMFYHSRGFMKTDLELGYSTLKPGQQIVKLEPSVLAMMQKLQQQMEAVQDMVKVVQDDIRAIDRKLESMKTENYTITSRLTGLEAKTDELNRSVSRIEDICDGMKYQNDSLAWDFDQISAYTRSMIESEIEKHAADGLGRVDYALASGGGRILAHSEPQFPVEGHEHMVHHDAIKMLQPSFGEPGMCFLLKGNSGFVDIRLRAEIILEAITLEHVAKSVAYEFLSAPKDFRVFAWSHPEKSTKESIKVYHLANFTYDLDKSNQQTFQFGDMWRNITVNVVRFEFISNYGSNSTCIYRLRVHGRELAKNSTKGGSDGSFASICSGDKCLALLAVALLIVVIVS